MFISRTPSPELSPEERDARTVFCMQLAARIRPRDLEEFFSAVGKVHTFVLSLCTWYRVSVELDINLPRVFSDVYEHCCAVTGTLLKMHSYWISETLHCAAYRCMTFGLFWTTNLIGRKVLHMWSLKKLTQCRWRWDSVDRGCLVFQSLSSRHTPSVTVLRVLQQWQWRHQVRWDRWDCMLDHCITTSARRCCVASLIHLERQVVSFVYTCIVM